MSPLIQICAFQNSFRRVRFVTTVTVYPPYALCLSVHMDQRGSQWMDFSEVSYWRLS